MHSTEGLSRGFKGVGPAQHSPNGGDKEDGGKAIKAAEKSTDAKIPKGSPEQGYPP